MTPERWAEVERIYHDALARESSDRASFLALACGDDDVLRREVESLLAQSISSSGVLDRAAVELAAHLVSWSGASSMIGRHLGVYQLQTLLGAGGMGEVYRARDTRLGRDVAIKVLPQTLTSHPDRLARFEREALVLASLNHPNIATIYGVEESNGVRALVMELIEGETLAERVAGRRGGPSIPPMSVAAALALARQIAEGLAAAHDKGIVHRDVKPANIKITPDGIAKVLDFGLAKLPDPPAGGRHDQQDSSLGSIKAVTLAGSHEGLVLGTAAYMSPEQARGQPVDKRTDVWAFGCVLYEMLTGCMVFAGTSVTDVLGEVLKSEPEWQRLPAETPETIRHLLRRCLEKDLRRRIHDIADARIEIDDALTGALTSAPATAATAPRTARRLAGVAVLVALVAITAGATMWIGAGWRTASAAPETRLDITTLPTTEPTSFAISPDGLTVVFAGTSQGQSALWLRALDAPSARPLAGTNGATYPFWSPDSQSIGFFAEGKLKRIDIAKGTAQTLANATLGVGGAWSRSGTIVYSPSPVSPLFRVSDTGGVPTALTRLQPTHLGHVVPQFLPDGVHFLYLVTGNSDVRGVYVGGLDGSTTPRVLDVEASATYAASGHVLFLRESTLFAQRLNPVRFALEGSPVRVADGIGIEVVGGNATRSAVSASSAGPTVYRWGSGESQRQLIWFNRSGHEIGRVSSPMATQEGARLSHSLSPDGRSLALHRIRQGKGDVWLLDLRRNVPSPFAENAYEPNWSPNGGQVLISSNRSGVPGVYLKAVAGGREEVLLTMQDKIVVALGQVAPFSTWLNLGGGDWSPDGRFLLLGIIGSKTLSDIWALPVVPAGDPFPVAQTAYEEMRGTFAPNGQWIAYHSNLSGQFEVYLRPLRSPDDRPQRVSTNGGTHARWRRDGKELFYVGLDGRLMAVPIFFAADGHAVEVGNPVALFETQMGRYWYLGPEYAVSPNGQRFLIDTATEEPSSPLTVIQNWKSDRK